VFIMDSFTPHTRSTEWQTPHAELCRISKRRSGLDYDEGTWLLAAHRCRVHDHLGYASFAEYAHRVLGHGPHETNERLRVAGALEKLPRLSRALREGELPWSALRELTRVATAETEAEWLQISAGRTVQQIQQSVSGLALGQRPGDAPRFQFTRHVLRLEVSGETMATFREAVAKLRRDAGGDFDDEAALLEMARTVLGGKRDAGRATYQVALSVCPRCQHGSQVGRGRRVDVGTDIIAMARCDAQDVGVVDASPSGRRSHVGPTRQRKRAQQTIPPATRRKVMRRHNGRCAVPGCSNATFVDVHHIDRRAAGGGHDENNLVVLCGGHHRAVHRGQLIIEGRYSTGLSFRHADGAPYGGTWTARRRDAQAAIFGALRKLGLTRRAARSALARSDGGGVPSVEELLRGFIGSSEPAEG
jgi:hypothetical protein